MYLENEWYNVRDFPPSLDTDRFIDVLCEETSYDVVVKRAKVTEDGKIISGTDVLYNVIAWRPVSD